MKAPVSEATLVAARPSTKQSALRLIRGMPEKVLAEDLLRALYVRLLVERRLTEVQAGSVISNAEARRRLRKWLQN